MSESTETTKQININPFAKPLAGKRTTKHLLKLVKKAAAEKGLKRGVKEVVKSLRKKEKGLVIIAGNISPIDVITHVPILCEDSNIAYVYVPEKESLGSASATKRPTSVVMVSLKSDSALQSDYQKVLQEVAELKEQQQL
eukprot:TRINITY_DN3295_c0_g1_i1.p1 TRINITY_DN3295_c0_g1~~TRINITY_DN3295_c0_g1_i1.p1  ORF type:complete len:140 (+),score=29.02 TRINITY_DN3295_c0_g1_i1:300-719(+)